MSDLWDTIVLLVPLFLQIVGGITLVLLLSLFINALMGGE